MRQCQATVSALAAITLSISAVRAGAAEPASIDAVMSAPFASNLTSSPDGEHIAWVETTQGRRSIWTASAPVFASRRSALFTEDDGQELGELAFAPDGNSIYFVRGGGANDKGTNPNPASLVLPTEQSIWRASTGGESQARVAKGAGIHFSPVTGDLVFENHGDTVVLRKNELGQDGVTPQILFHTAGSVSDLTGRPDGRMLAFVSRRGDHSFIGLFGPGDSHITWADPDTSQDQYPAWSPNGTSLAFLRVPGLKHGEAPDFSRNVPFAVWIYDVGSRSARLLWQSPGEDGTRYGWARARPVLWADEHTLIFTSEQDGWWRSYRLDVRNGRTTALTPESCELFGHSISVSAALYVAGTNCGDRDRRRLTLHDLRSGKESLLTKNGDIETDPLLLHSGHYLAFARSTATEPQAIYVRNLGTGASQRVSTTPGAAFLRQPQAVPQAVSFPSDAADRAQIYGQLLQSGDTAFHNKPRPALIFLHGGPVRQMLLGWPDLDYYDRMYAITQHFAACGYIVLSVNFRSSVGYGKPYRTAAGLGPHGALDSQDVLGAALYLRTLKEVDPRRIGVFGGSYGGYLASMALARHSDVFAAGVSLHGVQNWQAFALDAPLVKGGGWGIVGDEAEQIAFASSPIAALQSWRSPVLLIHGDEDRNVRFAQTVDLAVRLRERGVEVQALVLPDEDHHLTRHASWMAIADSMERFFDSHFLEPPP